MKRTQQTCLSFSFPLDRKFYFVSVFLDAKDNTMVECILKKCYFHFKINVSVNT